MDQVKLITTLRSGKIVETPILELREVEDNKKSKGKEVVNKLRRSEEITIVLFEPPFPQELNKLKK